MTEQQSGLIFNEPGVAGQLAFRYRNWRGEVSVRTARPLRMWWGSTEWHPEPQWMLTALDIDKAEERDFAVRDMVFLPYDDPDEAYEVGKQDGYSKAVQDIDLRTGGDGEYTASTIPGRGCPDPESMIQRIVERLPAPAPDQEGRP